MRSENQTRIIQGDSMDENNRNIRVVKTGGRKVTKTTTEYDWSRLEKRTLKEHKDVPERSVRREPTQLERKIRYQKKQKQQRLKITACRSKSFPQRQTKNKEYVKNNTIYRYR